MQLDVTFNLCTQECAESKVSDNMALVGAMEDEVLELQPISRTRFDAETTSDARSDGSFDQDHALPPSLNKRRQESFTLYTPDEERSVVRLLDFRVVMFLALLVRLKLPLPLPVCVAMPD